MNRSIHDSFSDPSATSPWSPPALLEQLRGTTLLGGFPDAHLNAVAGFSKRVHARENEVLFQEGEACGAVYVVLDGLVKLHTRTAQNRERVVEFIGAEESFAEAAMFSGQGYPVSATCLVDSTLLRIDAWSFTRYLHSHPNLTWTLLAVLSRRTHQLVGKIRNTALHGARQKVAGYLLERHAADAPDDPVEGLPRRRADLASAIGVTVETLCRVLADFRTHGWIDTHDSAITVRSPERLKSLTRDG